MKETIIETQQLLMEKKSRAKSSIELSPSTIAPKPKTRTKVLLSKLEPLVFLTITDLVQQVHGAVLPRDKTLPQLTCRSCERKVQKKVATMTKTIVKKSRAKSPIELSPSAIAPKPKTRTKRVGVKSYFRIWRVEPLVFLTITDPITLNHNSAANEETGEK